MFLLTYWGIDEISEYGKDKLFRSCQDKKHIGFLISEVFC
jgi:hypothetical protein